MGRGGQSSNNTGLFARSVKIIPITMCQTLLINDQLNENLRPDQSLSRCALSSITIKLLIRCISAENSCYGLAHKHFKVITQS